VVITDDWHEFACAALQVKGSVVDNNGRLRPADQIIRLNGNDVLTATREQIAQLLKVYHLLQLYLFTAVS